MYELGGPFRKTAVADGTNLLIAGPPMTGKQELGFRLLSHGVSHGEGAIVVTTKDGGERVLASLRQRSSPRDAPMVGVVDCVTRQQGMGGAQDRELLRYAASPVDLTGIGIDLSELLQTFYKEHGVTRNRTMLHSLSTLLMYSNLQTVFRFLHVFTGRVQSAEALGLYVIDSTAHEEQTMSTITQLFDGVVEVRETEDGGRECRIVGLEDVERTWFEV